VGTPPNPLPDECQVSTRCGDGIRDPVTEECDDGPGTEEDSCTASCRIHNIFVRPVEQPGGLRVRSRALGYGRHPVAAGKTASLVAFVQNEGSTSSLFGALFDHQGRRMSLIELGRGASTSQQANAVVAALPNGAFAVAWNDLGAGSLDVGLRRVSTTSSPVLESVRYANVTRPGAQQDPDLLWTGTELAAAWTDAQVIVVRRFGADLTALGAEQRISLQGEISGSITLASVGTSWAAAWRAIDAATSEEIVRIHSGSTDWNIGPFSPGASLERPALVELDADHLLVVFTQGTDPLATGTASVTRLRGAILSKAAPGLVQSVPLDPLVEPFASTPALSLMSPALARVGSRLFLGWSSEGMIGDPRGREIWVQELVFNSSGATLTRRSEEPVQVDALRAGDQLVPAFASSPLIPQGALVTVWEEHNPATRHETLPDVFFGLRPVPFVRLSAPSGG